ncbi:hypothetical protein NE848_04395 [Gramella jeungdoensis]|uniref:Uncharacterized protein n=1 Tax=Gramella jeungdoensis TaxID=708091 RepID=A0ABT0Z007_9FLAO|nr:hypothetical protein [Gramella jeungdoensis]MCM8568605.1 hypothetical protein [Gramella jeungdoensis]
MKALVNTFAAVVGSTIDIFVLVIDKISFGVSQVKTGSSHHLGDLGQGLNKEIEFELYHRRER